MKLACAGPSHDARDWAARRDHGGAAAGSEQLVHGFRPGRSVVPQARVVAIDSAATSAQRGERLDASMAANASVGMMRRREPPS